MFIDTHAHLYLKQFENDIDEVIEQSKNMNVEKIFLPNIDLASLQEVLSLSVRYPETCYPMIGLHPCSVDENYREVLDALQARMDEARFYGIGETGIDLYWDTSKKKEQLESFEIQISWARELGLPVIIHSRESLDLCIEVIEANQGENLKGVFHCFNGTVDQCRRVADLGFMMGLGGIVTYKNAGLDDMLRYMPEELMVLETDAPYLTPVPYRGKRNESSYVPLIASRLAEIREEPLARIAEISTRNAGRLFGIEA